MVLAAIFIILWAVDYAGTPIDSRHVLVLVPGLLAVLELLYLPPPGLPSENQILRENLIEQELRVHKQQEKYFQDRRDGRRGRIGLGQNMSDYDQQILIRQNAARIYQEICQDYDKMVSHWQQFTAFKRNYLASVLGTRSTDSESEASTQSDLGSPVPADATGLEAPNGGNDNDTREQTSEADNREEQKSPKDGHRKEAPESSEGGGNVSQHKSKEVKGTGVLVAPVPSTYSPDTREPFYSRLAMDMSD